VTIRRARHLPLRRPPRPRAFRGRFRDPEGRTMAVALLDLKRQFEAVGARTRAVVPVQRVHGEAA